MKIEKISLLLVTASERGSQPFGEPDLLDWLTIQEELVQTVRAIFERTLTEKRARIRHRKAGKLVHFPYFQKNQYEPDKPGTLAYLF